MNPRSIIKGSVCFVVLLMVCVSPKRIEPPFKIIDKEADHEFRRGLWIRAASTASPDSIRRIARLVDEMNVTDIFVQVVVGGYAYYKSDILPRSQYLSSIASAEYDPLDSLIRAFEDKPVLIHAWVNTLLNWSLVEPPESQKHVLHVHPDWFIYDVNKQSMADYSYPKWKNARLEGLYLNPENVDVRLFLQRICREIAAKYPVEGIHLDFIRYPGILWGLPDDDEAALFAGIDADIPSWCSLLRYGKSSVFQRWSIWQAWRLTRHREWIISGIITDISRTVQMHALRDDCVLSTAVFANPSLFRYSFAQNWTEWQNDIYFPVVMSYTPDVALFSDYLEFATFHRPDALLGIGFLWEGMKNTAQWQESAVKHKDGAGVCYFDFTNLDTMLQLPQWDYADPVDESLHVDSTRYEPAQDIFTDLPDDGHVEKGRTLIAWGDDIYFAAFLLSLSLNPVRDLARMGITREEFLHFISDDVAAFKYLNKEIFPIGENLIEPPRRKVRYAFLPWLDDDSTTVIARADQMYSLENHVVLYPLAPDPFIKAVFITQPLRREVLVTKAGVYVFVVEEIYDGGRVVKREAISTDTVPVYLNWTIKKKAGDLLGNID
jgi:uncharacterized lipoprotein YddW (UPF0748 family)